jgi:hypothetical protein
MSDEEPIEAESLSDLGYTAFEKWEYKPIIHKMEHRQPWIGFADSFYRASLVLVDNREGKVFFEDIAFWSVLTKMPLRKM